MEALHDYKWTKLWRNLGRGTRRTRRKQGWLTGKHSCILRIAAMDYVPICKTWRLIVSKSLDTINVSRISTMFMLDLVCTGTGRGTDTGTGNILSPPKRLRHPVAEPFWDQQWGKKRSKAHLSKNAGVAQRRLFLCTASLIRHMVLPHMALDTPGSHTSATLHHQ